jgi:hypothetical protein
MRVIVGCEYSQIVTMAFRKKRHEAYSCDIIPCEGGHPEWHFQDDIFEVLKRERFDIGIFHHPCTYLTNSANKWLKDQPKRKSGTLVGEERRNAREESIAFVFALQNCGIPRVAIENPIGCISTFYRKPDQIIQPYMFGEDASKSTCLWLEGLPKLEPTNIVPPMLACCGHILPDNVGMYGCPYCGGVKKPKKIWGNQTPSGQNKLGPSEYRWKLRSTTYLGIAEAMAAQWGDVNA